MRISMAMFVMAMQIGKGLGPMMFGGIVDFAGIESESPWRKPVV